MKIETHHTKLFFYLIILGFLGLLIYSILIYSNKVFAQTENQPQPLENSKQIIPPKSNLDETIKEDILAKAYVIYDINNKKVIRSQNALTPLPIASLTKIITVGTLMDTAKKNNIQLRDETQLIIKKALVKSSNEDADSLGDIYSYSFGKDLLADANTFVNNLGILDVHLTNLTGLDNYDGTASNIGSAESLAKIFAYDYQNNSDIFEYTKFGEVDTEGETIVNTNQTTEKTFGIMVSKTGFTYDAGGNLGVVVTPEPGSAYVVVVMGSTKEGRFEDVQKIVKLLPLILKN